VSLASEAARLLVVNGALSATQLSSFTGDVAGLLLYGIAFGALGILMAKRALRAK